MNNRISQDDIIYFIITDRFFGTNKINADPSDKLIHGGTLDGIVEKLDYLSKLGITAIWVTPVYENINRVVITGRFMEQGRSTGIQDHIFRKWRQSVG